MSNFKGYYMKINNCTFTNPQIAKDKWKYSPRLVQVTDSGQVASGKLTMKVLPHVRKRIDVGFPPMTPEQFRVYWNALKGEQAGEGMYLQVEVYNDAIDKYETDTFYHNDLVYTVHMYNGKRYIQINDFALIGH